MAEEVYQQALEVELSVRGIPFRTKHGLSLSYKGQLLEVRYVPDLIVFDRIVVELKAVANLIAEHEAQLFNYMRIAHQEVGYLLNFGQKNALDWKRFILSDLHQRLGPEDLQPKLDR
jgi:GxxExxY protein